MWPVGRKMEISLNLAEQWNEPNWYLIGNRPSSVLLGTKAAGRYASVPSLCLSPHNLCVTLFLQISEITQPFLCQVVYFSAANSKWLLNDTISYWAYFKQIAIVVLEFFDLVNYSHLEVVFHWNSNRILFWHFKNFLYKEKWAIKITGRIKSPYFVWRNRKMCYLTQCCKILHLQPWFESFCSMFLISPGHNFCLMCCVTGIILEIPKMKGPIRDFPRFLHLSSCKVKFVPVRKYFLSLQLQVKEPIFFVLESTWEYESDFSVLSKNVKY